MAAYDYSCRHCHCRTIPPPAKIFNSSQNLTVLYYVIFFVVIFAGFMPNGASALNLTCYSCNTTDENNVCYQNVSEAPIQVCDPTISTMTCSVYREDKAGKFTFITRGCNTSCIERCGAWGEKEDIDKCSSCCDTDLCNVDDAASALWTATMASWLHPSVVVAEAVVVSWMAGASLSTG